MFVTVISLSAPIIVMKPWGKLHVHVCVIVHVWVHMNVRVYVLCILTPHTLFSPSFRGESFLLSLLKPLHAQISNTAGKRASEVFILQLQWHSSYFPGRRESGATPQQQRQLLWHFRSWKMERKSRSLTSRENTSDLKGSYKSSGESVLSVSATLCLSVGLPVFLSHILFLLLHPMDYSFQNLFTLHEPEKRNEIRPMQNLKLRALWADFSSSWNRLGIQNDASIWKEEESRTLG